MSHTIVLDQTMSLPIRVGLLRQQVASDADLQLDSRAVQPGDVFLACPGMTGDGRDYIDQAMRRGAAAVLMHAEDTEQWTNTDWPIPVFAWIGLRKQLGALADTWYALPSASLKVIALTGTNGKTSCAQWLADVLTAQGTQTGVIGTLGVRGLDGMVGVERVDHGQFAHGPTQAGTLTTPDVVSMHRTLATMLRNGAQVVVVEASSIGLDQGRLDGVRVHAAAFTNLSRDHLDYHRTMAAYEAAKARLFAWPDLVSRHINVDDEAGRRIAQQCAEQNSEQNADWSVHTFGCMPTSMGADLRAQAIDLAPTGVSFTLSSQSDSVSVSTQLLGQHNVSNLLCVASILVSLGWRLAQIADAFSKLVPVDGRMQVVLPIAQSTQAGAVLPHIIVDYAHTPDALERALQALRPLAQTLGGKLWCVFGCGGHRDAGKRPLMGAIAIRDADHVYVTSDNPRDEMPEAIIAQIVAGLPLAANNVVIESDRAQAILGAVLRAEPNDVVLLAGKGHETYQEILGTRTYFDDRQWGQMALLLKSGLDLQSDSRKITEGAVFLALSGENFDGHDYLAEVQQAGAIAAIVNTVQPTSTLPQIVVADTRQALLQLGQAWRRQFDIPVIAVTGSNGKTTTKEMIASILAVWLGASHRLATAGNLNNELGVPFTLLRLNPEHRAAVIELGMNHPGEIAVLTHITAPTVALVNNAQREHQEFMVSVEAVAEENGQVLLHLPAHGVAVYPAEDTFTALWARMSGSSNKMCFGLSDYAHVWPSDIQADVLGTAFLMHTPSGAHAVMLPVPGEHNLRNALAAASCCLAAGAPLKAVAQGLSDFQAVTGRMQPYRLADGVILIDDTYNANPDSVRAAIEVLARLDGPRVLVLGDMGEVGDNGPAMHEEVGAYARTLGIEYLVTLGEATKHSARAFGPSAVMCEAIEHVRDTLYALNVKSLLIKGSRFMRMERIARAYVERLTVVPEEVVNHAV